MKSVSAIGTAVAIGLLLGFSVYEGVLNVQQGQAICTLRGDLEKRVKSTNDFLKTHPKGFAGISVATLRKGVMDQQRTIDALKPVSC